MKGIRSLNDLHKELTTKENIWLLLYKKGSEQSDCAFKNFQNIEETKNALLCFSDVNEVKDIHKNYGVNSVPTLMNFERGELKNVVKGCQNKEQFKTIIEKSTFVSKIEKNKKPGKSVTVYTTPTCSWCTVIKRHLQENNIHYREVNVALDQKAAEEMVKKSGQQGVPQTEINGEIIVGFDKVRINNLLGIN